MSRARLPLLLRPRARRRGFALGTVLMFLTFFFILASAVLFASKQEQPIIDKIDDMARARYAANGLLDVIELKMKTLDAEFHAALLDDEKMRAPTDPVDASKSELFNEFFADFRDTKRLMTSVGYSVPGMAFQFLGVERQHIEYKENNTATSVEKHYVDVLRVTVSVTWMDGTTGKPVTDRYAKTIRFKRLEKS